METSPQLGQADLSDKVCIDKVRLQPRESRYQDYRCIADQAREVDLVV